MLVVECLRQEISSGSSVYPVYVGFLPAADIARVAEAPAFTISTPHQQIAANVASQPVRDWQRPLDTGRIGGIADTFDNTGSLMPNPILLGQNAFVNGAISITPKLIGSSGQMTGTWEVNINDTNLQEGQRPLWILDGQHRVAGLTKSKQKLNPVPIVFLLDGGSGSYTSPLLASLFAQVTTSATKLDDLHNEWLTFAFELDSYNPLVNQTADAERKAFQTVVELCRTPSFGALANPFLNAVQFNEHVTSRPVHGGFIYKCTALKNLIFRSYYNQPSSTGHLDPSGLAAQIALAYTDLWSVIGSQPNSVFFGPTGKQQTIMHDAYLTGALARILKVGVQTTWTTVLQSLMFHQSDWDFSWARTLSGPANTASKRIATDVLTDAMSSGTLPQGSSNIPDHLRGNGANVTVTCSAVSASGRPRRAGRQSHVVLRGSTGSQIANQHPHVKVTAQSSNIGKLEVVDATVAGRQVHYPQILQRGMVLTTEPNLPNPLELMFIMTHYGGLTSQAELRVSW
jgi:hypothetical protein